MFLSDLHRIANGEEEYGHVSADLRRAGLQHLIALLAEHAPKLRLVMADDTLQLGLRAQFRDGDSLFVSGNALVMWRDHSGTLYWSEHPQIVCAKRSAIRRCATRTAYRNPPEVIQVLQRLLRSARSG